MMSKMEELLGLGQIQTVRTIPGTQAVENREFIYIQHNEEEPFPTFFKRLVRHVTPPIPTSGGVLVEGCRISLPDGEVFYAISYKGDLHGWRQQIKLGAEAFNRSLGRIVNESLIFDNKPVDLVNCQIEFE